MFLYLFYIFLGFLPGLIWLSFYLKKDRHPEPNSIVLKLFFWGMLLTPPAIVLELLLIWLLNPDLQFASILLQTPQNGFIRIILAATLVPALVEEYLKYAIIRFKFLKNSEFDEPTDIMLYCIIVGLGFASVENLLVLFKISSSDVGQAIGTMALRFFGATLVHALACGIVGYWLAKGLLKLKNRKKMVSIGLTIAIVFHSCYNYLVVAISRQTAHEQRMFSFLLTAVLLAATAFLVSFYFRKLKKQQSVCKIYSR